jgi:tRNA pseudouridine55 synthase
MDGLLVVNKPVGPSSHDVVARVRRALREPRVGHTGTLDPLASGVLPLVLGRATRLARFLSGARKRYEAEICLGIATTTCDREGAATGTAYDGPWPDAGAIEQALDAFRGVHLQRPPAFSAKKVAGRRSYKDARKHANAGKPDGPLAPVEVDAAVELVALESNHLTLRVECSAGFYVRSLAHDLGQRLGTGAHLSALVRTASGECTLAGAVALDAIDDPANGPAAAEAALIPLSRMMPGLAAVALTDEGVKRASHGRDVRTEDMRSQPADSDWHGCVRLVDSRGDLIGMAEPKATSGLLHPFVVLV